MPGITVVHTVLYILCKSHITLAVPTTMLRQSSAPISPSIPSSIPYSIPSSIPSSSIPSSEKEKHYSTYPTYPTTLPPERRRSRNYRPSPSSTHPILRPANPPHPHPHPHSTAHPTTHHPHNPSVPAFERPYLPVHACPPPPQSIPCLIVSLKKKSREQRGYDC